MSKATAGVEVPALAEKHGWELKSTHRDTVAFFHHDRNEGFTLCCGEDGFSHATWHAPLHYIIVADKRKPGERGARDGTSLVANSKRRAVGMGDVRAEMLTSPKGLDVGYLDLKRRIENPDWRKP